MKKFISVILSCGVAGAVLVGCGNNTASTNSPEKQSVSEPSKATDSEKPSKTQQDTSEFIGEEKAKQIALDKAGLGEDEVKFIKTELERDDGVYVYDVEFMKDGVEYNAEIKADDGNIIEWDTDIED